jgi:hypothetical protein
MPAVTVQGLSVEYRFQYRRLLFKRSLEEKLRAALLFKRIELG